MNGSYEVRYRVWIGERHWSKVRRSCCGRLAARTPLAAESLGVNIGLHARERATREIRDREGALNCQLVVATIIVESLFGLNQWSVSYEVALHGL